ncbi:hypothetical protein BV22DRAFT_1133373 [Leucogyrophana mollusca]|uniref:Uncharacterized protein n=1 Tax=Leucogyrophana mollusca TaxID=85980 RepID=A0ACB8B481_9AGAM|nr:hypothetical protein BV22DRAFT_1133373 [Leucogyrophana mollusca]
MDQFFRFPVTSHPPPYNSPLNIISELESPQLTSTSLTGPSGGGPVGIPSTPAVRGYGLLPGNYFPPNSSLFNVRTRRASPVGSMGGGDVYNPPVGRLRSSHLGNEESTSRSTNYSSPPNFATDLRPVARSIYPHAQGGRPGWLPPSRTQLTFDHAPRGFTPRPLNARPDPIYHFHPYRREIDTGRSSLQSKVHHSQYMPSAFLLPSSIPGSAAISSPSMASTSSHSPSQPPLPFTQLPSFPEPIHSAEGSQAATRIVQGLREIYFYLCKWGEAGSFCDRHFASDKSSISLHFRERHGITNRTEAVRCLWFGCGAWMRGDCFSRHLQTHIIEWKCSNCGNKVARPDVFRKHLKNHPGCLGARPREMPGVGANVADVSASIRG